MANHHRGEIEAELDGRRYTLCLTLGALAELEHGFGEADMLSLATRFENGRLSARDAIRILAAGLRGGGNDLTDEEVARMSSPSGAAGFVAIVARLLEATFSGGSAADEHQPGEPVASGTLDKGGEPDVRPFPGSGQ